MTVRVERFFITRNDPSAITISVASGAGLQPMTYQEAAHHSSVLSVGDLVMPRIYASFDDAEGELAEEFELELPEQIELELPDEVELVGPS